MKTFFYRFLIQHWARKLISILLAVIIWLLVNHSLTSTRNISNIPVRIVHLPQGKTIEGMQSNGKLAKKLTLTVVGNKTVIDELTPSDLEVVIDAEGRPDEWIVNVNKKNLVSFNPEINIDSGITRVYHPSFSIRMTKLITDKIPIIVTQPIGEPPRGYQFLDVWPYNLSLTVSGPEEVIKRLKIKEQRITFNLNDISKSQLDELSLKQNSGSDIVSFYVPEEWKQIHIPTLSDAPIDINDPQAEALRIDFVRYSLLPVNASIPLSLFFPTNHLYQLNPDNTLIAPNELIALSKGVPVISIPLYATGVDNLFLDMVRDRIEIVIVVAPPSERKLLDWSVQFINPRSLEDQYIASLMSDVSDRDTRLMQPALREEYLRNRFRSYMNHFQLFYADDSKFDLAITLDGGKIYAKELSSHKTAKEL